MKIEYSILLKELMDDLNGSDRLCDTELTASYVTPILNKNGKFLKKVRYKAYRRKEYDNS